MVGHKQELRIGTFSSVCITPQTLSVEFKDGICVSTEEYVWSDPKEAPKDAKESAFTIAKVDQQSNSEVIPTAGRRLYLLMCKIAPILSIIASLTAILSHWPHP